MKSMELVKETLLEQLELLGERARGTVLSHELCEINERIIATLQCLLRPGLR